MANIRADRVRETTNTTGTGPVTLAGAATGYQRFNAVMSVGDTCYYCIAGQGTSQWETGLGTYSSTNVLTRTTIIASSNANAAVNFTGTNDVFLTYLGSLALLNTDIVNSDGTLGVSLGSNTISLSLALGNANTWSGKQTFSTSTISITGGTSGYVLSTNGSGVLSWVAQSGGSGSPGGSNTQLQYNNSGSFAGTAAGTYANSGALFTFTSQNTGDVPITINGISGQTGNLQEYYLNGTLKSYLDPNGVYTRNISYFTGGEYIRKQNNTFLHTGLDYYSVFLGLATGNLTNNVSQNVGIGGNVMPSVNGYGNVGVGFYCLQSLTTGNSNVGIGPQALQSLTTGSNNTALGAYALENITTQSSNTAIGYNSLNNLTTGNNNLAIGAAFAALTTGSNNTGLNSAGRTLTTGSNNIFIGTENSNVYNGTDSVVLGAYTYQNATSGDHNVIIGGGAGNGMTTGATNTCVGLQAGLDITTGSNNTFLGTQAGSGTSTATVNNSVAIGNTSGVTANNTFALGGVGSLSTQLVVNGTSATSQFDLNIYGSSRVGQIITLAASASADAFRVNNNSGTTLSLLDKSGCLVIGATSSINSATFGAKSVEIYGAGSSFVLRDSNRNYYLTANNFGSGTTFSIFDSYASAYRIFLDPSGSLGVGLATAGTFPAQVNIISTATGTKGLVVNTQASPTVNNAEFQINGTVEIQVDKNGLLGFPNATSGAASSIGTLTNAPAAGNPQFWIPVTVNGTAYWIPAWHA